MSKELIIIAGVAKNNVIGNKNQLPWHIKEDLQRFKKLTLGHPVIMGRKTYESILETLGKPLPGRTNVIITNQQGYHQQGIIITHSIQESIEKAYELSNKIFVIGVEKIYEQFLSLADRLEITHIHRSFEGDAKFPEISPEEWLEIKTKDYDGTNLEFTFSTYQKKKDRCLPKEELEKEREDELKEKKVDVSEVYAKLKEKIESLTKEIEDLKYLEKKHEDPNKGIFITFEGIDGCGKSTQIRELTKHIFEKSKHNHIILTRNPYKNTNIRKILTEDSDPNSQSEKLAELYIADRIKQTNELIIPNLENGHFVISDRYKLSTIIYQSAQGLDMKSLIEKQSSLPIPDMTFVIDVSPEEAQMRMRKESVEIRGKEHKFEANLEFIHKLRENIFKAKDLLSEKIFIINGERSREEITKEICEIFDRESLNC